MDDAQLIERTLAGDSAAFGDLVHKYQDRLYNTMSHIIGNSDDALDVVQEAFILAYVKLNTFQQSSRFYTWLYRIAFNVGASHRRKRRPVASIDLDREQFGEEPVAAQDGPELRFAREERRLRVWEAIERLGDEHRDVIVLRDIDGCGYEEIAEILDVPIGTVRSRLHRARNQLKDDLEFLMDDF